MAYDKPGWAKRIEALERVRDDMKANVLSTQYLHNTRHYTGGDDPLTPANIGAADRVHTHVYKDITNIQELLNALGDYNLDALAAILKSKYSFGNSGKLLWTQQYTNLNDQAHKGCVRLTMTPGRFLVWVPRPNEDPGRGDFASISVTTNLWSLCSGLQIGKRDSEPKIYYPGQYKRYSAAEVNATYDTCYNSNSGSPMHNTVGASDGIEWNAFKLTPFMPYLVKLSTVRLYVPFVGDIDYPVAEFYEY